MSEKAAQTKKKILKNIDKITIGVLVLILLGLGYAWWQESNNTLGRDPVNRRPVSLVDDVADSPSFKMLQGMSSSPALENSPDIQRLTQINMFDNSTLDAERNLETQAQAQFQQAQELIAAGNKDQAREILLQVEKVLKTPDVIKALDSVTTPTTEMPVDASAAPVM